MSRQTGTLLWWSKSGNKAGFALLASPCKFVHQSYMCKIIWDKKMHCPFSLVYTDVFNVSWEICLTFSLSTPQSYWNPLPQGYDRRDQLIALLLQSKGVNWYHYSPSLNMMYSILKPTTSHAWNGHLTTKLLRTFWCPYYSGGCESHKSYLSNSFLKKCLHRYNSFAILLLRT